MFAPQERPADHPGHQRRRDVADRPGHPATSSTRARPASRATASAPRCSACRSSRSARPAPTSGRAAAAACADGICIRLYSEEDFDGPARVHRPRDPAHQPRLGHPPDDEPRAGRRRPLPVRRPARQRQIADGVRLLEELRAFATGDAAPTAGTVGRGRRLTAYGTTLAPAAARPAARPDGHRGRTGSAALREVLVVVAALSIQDPRERPGRARSSANASHKRFADERVRLRRLAATSVALPQGAAEGAVAQRLPADVQGRVPALPADPRVAGPARPAPAGVPSRRRPRRGHLRSAHGELDLDTMHQCAARRPALARRRPRRGRSASMPVRGARGSASVPVRPCSASSPQFVMAGELVETTRLWARMNARDRPGVGRGGRRATSSSGRTREPRWSARPGRRSRPSGSPSTACRSSSTATIGYARVDRRGRARPLRPPALVEGDWEPQHDFCKRQRRHSSSGSPSSRRAPGDATSSSTTRRCIAFYDKRIPPRSCSAAALRPLVEEGRAARRPDLLTFTEELLLRRERAEQVAADDYPTTLAAGRPRPRRDLPVRAGERRRTASPCTSPSSVLNRVTADGFDWQVPGLREDLVTALIRSPAQGDPATTWCRRPTTPGPCLARERDPARRRAAHRRSPGCSARRAGVAVGRRQDWDVARVPAHLRVTFSVDGPDGRVVARGQGPRGAARRRPSRSCAGRWPAPGRRWSAPASPRGSSARRARDVRATSRRPGASRATRRSSTTGTSVDAAGPADPRRGGRRAPARGAPAAAAQHHAAVEAGAGPAHQRPEARPRRTTRTGRCPPCSTTAWPPRSTPSRRAHDCPGEVRTREAFAAGARRRAHAHAATGACRSSGWSSRSSPSDLELTNRLGVLDAVSSAARSAPMLGRRAGPAARAGPPGFVADTGVRRLRDLDRYLRAMQHRLDRAPANLARDARAPEQVDARRGPPTRTCWSPCAPLGGPPPTSSTSAG